jgi:hypothetical protein
LKGGEVLEEVAALRRGDAKILEAGLDNHAGAGDLVPLDAYAEPWIVRAPPADRRSAGKDDSPHSRLR